MPQKSLSVHLRIVAKFFLALWVLCLFIALRADDVLSKSLMNNGLNRKSFVSETKGTWQISAKRISYDKKNHVYEAEGNVRITSGDRLIEAAWARLDADNHEADLKGNVYLKYDNDWLRGEHVVWNLEKETGKVDGGLIYFAENHFYVRGKEISKTGPGQYELKDGFVTTCDPQNPDWKVKYKEMKVDTGGIAWAKHTSFWARNIPLLYTPIIAIPVDKDRQSGFLLPWAGSSSLNGLQAEVPYFWAIRQDMDMTFYERYMQERGWMSGLEYRIANQTWGEGIWLGNYLRDQASKEHLADYGYPYVKSDRYWIRARHSLELPYGIEGKLDLDIASDKNYLKEFKNGSTSYAFTDDLFRKMTGRGVLNDETILARENTLYLNRRGDSSLLFMDAIYWDQLDRSIDQFTLQRLPELSFNVIPAWIDGLPLYYSLATSGIDYWRQEGDTGYRLDVYPRVNYPLHWKTYLDVEPSVGLRSTSYAVNWEENSRDTWQQRTLPDVKLELTSRLNRVYPFKVWNYVALQHGIRPEIVYEYQPKVKQNDLPQFDGLDDIEERHGITYGFSNFLIAKGVHLDAQGNQVSSYREFARLQIFQTLNIREASTSESNFSNLNVDNLNIDNLNVSDVEEDDGVDSSELEKKRFSPVNLLLDVFPGRYLTLTYDTQFSPDEGAINRHDLYATLDSGTGYFVRAGYQFYKDTVVDEVIMEAGVKVLSNIFLTTYHDYSFDKEELFKQAYGVRYQHGCWGLGLTYQKEGEDNRFAFSIDLLGLGHFGAGQ